MQKKMVKRNETLWSELKKINMTEIKQKTYQLLITKGDHQMVINTEIGAFGKWKEGSSEFYTEGVIYPLLGDGDFDRCIKFLNNRGTVDEASVTKFEVATRGQYIQQFTRLAPKKEEIPTPEKAKPNHGKKVAKRQRSVASKAK